MAENSKISWTDSTFNPWMGCQKWSKGCDNCYADKLTSGRMGLDVFGGRSKRQRTSAALWRRPAKWNRQSAHDAATGEGLGRVHRVFCASLADVFEDAPGPNEWREDVWAIIRATPWLDYQILTKRPENIAAMLPPDWGEGWPNVWLGTSIEDRHVVDRARVLAAAPAFSRFISYEPAIGPVFFDFPVPGGREKGLPGNFNWTEGDGDQLRLDGIDWLIAGGESGPGFRPMDLGWAHDARRECEATGTAFFFKQVSGARPGQGEDALGKVEHNFPTSWDRADLTTHPVYAEQAGAPL